MCSKMMAKESGATSFIAMVQLPAARLKEALATPVMKVLRAKEAKTEHIYTTLCIVSSVE